MNDRGHDRPAEPCARADPAPERPGRRRLDQVFGEVLAHSVDFADLYFQLAHQESWSLEDGIVKDGSASIEQGVGVRALAGEKTGFAYSDEIVLPALEEASRAARAIAVQGGDRQVSAWRAKAGHQLYLPADPAAALATEEKVAWLERVDREARKARSARRARHGEPGGRARGGADRHQRGRAGRGRAPAGALQRLGAGRAGRPARAGLRRLRRPLLARGAGGGRAPAGARARGGAPGAGEPRGGAGAGRDR